MKEKINTVVSQILWSIMLWAPTWLFNSIKWQWLKKFGLHHHCSMMARRVQQVDGGLIVSTIKVEWPQGKTCGHFMNYCPSGYYAKKYPDTKYDIFDGFGSTAYKYGFDFYKKAELKVGERVDFGNGEYVIVDVVEKWEDLGIRSFKDLLVYTEKWHEKILNGEI